MWFFNSILTMKIIVCLGNPGPKYRLNRHNIGFLTGDYLVDLFNFQTEQQKFKSIIVSGLVEDQKVMIMFPQTYMNLSGQALQLAMSYFKVTAENVMVIYDDFELIYGTIRYRDKGSAGTHNGMKSIVSVTGSIISRIRVGVGPLVGNQVDRFVLSDFSQDQHVQMDKIFKQISDLVTKWVKGDTSQLMNLYNNRMFIDD